MTSAGGSTTTVATKGASLIQFGTVPGAGGHAPANADAVNVTWPSGSASISKTLDVPSGASKSLVTVR